MIVKLEKGNMKDLYQKKILLFGAASLGERSIEEFDKVGAKIVGFIDNNERLRKTKLCGYTIYTPNDIKAIDYDKIIITSTYSDEISEQLKKMNINNYDVIQLGALRDRILEEKFHRKVLTKEDANEYLKKMIHCKKPCFVGRLGSNELECITEYYYLLHRNINQKESYHNNLKIVMKQGAGFFPTTDEMLDLFSKMYLGDLRQLDFIWDMWSSKWANMLYKDFIPDIPIGFYDDTAFPIDIDEPWTNELAGKRVLVIHPFEESIICNYMKKELLFKNKKILPDFDLITMKPVQSLGNVKPDFENWFMALESMKNEIVKNEFDIALIGAGAYGFPLGAYIKQLGKKAFHVGGMLQLYFGIKGKAWNKFGYYNDNWTSPKETEKPEGYKNVEAGRYW